MTQSNREQVEKLRKQGTSYAGIAARVGLSENTIKSYCRRKRQQVPMPPAEIVGICPQCGAQLPEKGRGKPRRYCSDTCRIKWWYKYRRPARIEALTATICVGCGKTFYCYASAGRKYCCHGCYIKARFEGSAGHDQRAV